MRYRIFMICFVLCHCALHGQSPLLSDTLYSHEIIPEILSPKENSTIYHGDVNLVWSVCADIEKYRLQLSQSKSFEKLICDTIISSTYLVIDHLVNHKEYFWRISAVVKNQVNVFSECSFFKTTNIVITGQKEQDKIILIPTHIDDQDILYIDNPYVLSYHIEILDENKDTKFMQRCASEKMAVPMNNWPRGEYTVSVSNANGLSLARNVILN